MPKRSPKRLSKKSGFEIEHKKGHTRRYRRGKVNWVYWIITAVCIAAIVLGLYFGLRHKGPSGPSGPPPNPGTWNEESLAVLSYLNAVFPHGGLLNKKNITPNDSLELYDSLSWYYLPLVRAPNPTRRLPLKGPYKDAETQWFMADGADCGAYDKNSLTFSCSVFGGSCQSWEYGSQYGPNSGGRPYQQIAFIKPYSNRNGVPNNSYIECVAFFCEGLGKMLTNTGPNTCAPGTYSPSTGWCEKKCNQIGPPWKNFLLNAHGSSKLDKYNIEYYTDSQCTSTTSCDNQPAGCKINQGGGDIDICCWDYNSSPAGPDKNVCKWPTMCLATQDNPGGEVFNNYCDVPCGYQNCDVTSNCTWNISGTAWEDYFSLKKYPSGGEGISSQIITDLQEKVKPVLSSSSTQPLPRIDDSAKTTMFYWCKGYGKFLNMGKTGVYFSYIHFLLTCPKKSGTTSLRWSFPQIFQAATMAGGDSALKDQLKALIGEVSSFQGDGGYTDNRKYLEGYVTTFRDKNVQSYFSSKMFGTNGVVKFEGDGGVEVTNNLLYQTENVNRMVNPLDDTNLVNVNKYTVTKYYDPDKEISNPQYRHPIKFPPLLAIYLLQGMHIYGATSSSRRSPHVIMGKTLGNGTWPFGVFFSGATLGGCVYKLINMLKWNSAQFTQLSTGAGGTKYCNYPEHDYEIVYVGTKDTVCYTDMKMINPLVDKDNYIKNGFITGSKVNSSNSSYFDPSIMKLSERNIPLTWKGPLPNSIAYKQRSKYIKDTTKCPYSDDVYNKFAANHNDGINWCGDTYICTPSH